jgi:hypothetical protein
MSKLIAALGSLAAVAVLTISGISTTGVASSAGISQPPARFLIGSGGGASELESPSRRGNIPQADLVYSGTLAIASYPPLGTLILTTTQKFVGNFGSNPYFYPCANASGLAFHSTGGTCTLNSTTQRISCPTGITAFEYSYACAIIPELQASNLTLELYASWIGGTIDRTWDLTYSPLVYQSASITPDFDTGQMLRWTQIDAPSINVVIRFKDPRVHALFLPATSR